MAVSRAAFPSLSLAKYQMSSIQSDLRKQGRGKTEARLASADDSGHHHEIPGRSSTVVSQGLGDRSVAAIRMIGWTIE